MTRSEIWIALTTILLKEVRRFTRIWIQTLLPPAIMMTLYLSFLAISLGRASAIWAALTICNTLCRALL